LPRILAGHPLVKGEEQRVERGTLVHELTCSSKAPKSNRGAQTLAACLLQPSMKRSSSDVVVHRPAEIHWHWSVEFFVAVQYTTFVRVRAHYLAEFCLILSDVIPHDSAHALRT
jgi:hypothetical protein